MFYSKLCNDTKYHTIVKELASLLRNYDLLQDSAGNTYLNGSGTVYLRINNQNILYYNAGGFYNSNHNQIHSDDRLKYQEEGILG